MRSEGTEKDVTGMGDARNHDTSSNDQSQAPRDTAPLDTEYSAGLIERTLARRRAMAIGDLLCDRYRITGFLGEGGMSAVYQAVDQENGGVVAVKLLDTSLGDEDASKRLIQEARILADVRHRSVVRFRSIVEESDRLVLVMDRIEGRTMDEVVRNVRIESKAQAPIDADGSRIDRARRDTSASDSTKNWFSESARIMAETCDAIEAAHRVGIVHRDLKLKNVMWGLDDRPVVIDFGLGGRLEASTGTLTRAFAGTPYYFAPEQIEAHRTLKATPIDVFQLGGMLYELLTWRPASRSDRDERNATPLVLERIRRSDFESPRSRNPAVPRELDAICLHAMEHRPEDRPVSAAELAADLRRFLEGRPVRAPHAKAWFRWRREAKRACRRSPRATLTAGFVVFAVAAVAVGMHFLSPKPSLDVETAWRFDRSTEAPQVLSGTSTVQPGDWLGVKIESDLPAVVYACTITGSAERSSQYVLPIRPRMLLEFADQGANARLSESVGSYGLRIPSGSIDVALARVGEESNGEGLLVFVSHERLRGVEAWFEEIGVHYEEHFGASFPGVPRADVESLIPANENDVARGESLDALSLGEIRDQLRNLRAAREPGATERGNSLGVRFEAWFPVAGRGK